MFGTELRRLSIVFAMVLTKLGVLHVERDNLGIGIRLHGKLGGFLADERPMTPSLVVGGPSSAFSITICPLSGKLQ